MQHELRRLLCPAVVHKIQKADGNIAIPFDGNIYVFGHSGFDSDEVSINVSSSNGMSYEEYRSKTVDLRNAILDAEKIKQRMLED